MPRGSTSKGVKCSLFLDMCMQVTPGLLISPGTKDMAKINGFGPSGTNITDPDSSRSYAISHSFDTINEKSSNLNATSNEDFVSNSLLMCKIFSLISEVGSKNWTVS